MTKIIENLFICIAIFVVMGGCDKGYSENSLSRGIGDYMISNILQMEEFTIPSYYYLKDTDGKLCRIDSVFVKPKLVFRFNEFHCDNCIKSCVELINGSGMNDNVVALVSGDNIRMLRFIKKKYDIIFPTYFIPTNHQYMLSDLKEKSGYPYFFLLDSDFRAKYLFSPSQLYSEVSKEYLNKLAIMLNEKNKVGNDIFLLKNIDLGTIIKGKKYKVKFEYTNRTSDLLIINDVKTSCGCMLSKWEKKPLTSQASANLIIEFTPENLGYTSKTIVVSHNKSNYPVRLMIRANVVTR